MLSQLGHYGLVIPLARAYEKLDRLAGQPGLNSDRFASLPLQAAEQATDHESGVLPLLDPVELGQVALEKANQSIGAAANSLGQDRSVVQECLGLGMIEERHGGSPFRIRDLLTAPTS